MAIYQAPRRRWRVALIAGVLGALLGLGIGLALGGGEADPLVAIRQLDRALEEAAAPLEVLVIHGEADTGSSTDERVVNDAVARTQQRFDEVRNAVRAINADAADEFDAHVRKLRELASDDADPDEIADEADELADLLRDIIRA